MTDAKPRTTARMYLGTELQRLRVMAGLSQRDVATRVGTGHATVLRTERGDRIPPLPELAKWGDALSLDEATRRRLERLADTAFSEAQSWRDAIRGRSHAQDDEQALEASSGRISILSLAVAPGLLQTASYATALFDLLATPGQDTSAAVAGRMRRQEILYDPAHHVDLVTTEEALRFSPGPGVLPAQLDRIASLIGLPTVTVGIVPAGAAPVPAQHSFTVYTDRDEDADDLTTIELLTSRVTLSDPDDVARYAREFELWRDAALHGDQAVALVRQIASSLA